jgi:ABC-2 type transport system permease protein
MFWVSFVALVRKEFLQVLRDPRMLFMLLFVPVVQVTIFGFAANLELLHVDVLVVDEDVTEESRAFASALGAEGTFIVEPSPTPADAQAIMNDGHASAIVILPRGFARKVSGDGGAAVQVLIDGSDSSRAQSAANAIEQFVATRAGRGQGLVTMEPRLLFNPGLKSRIFMVPGTAASVLIIITTVVTAMGLAREREVGTLDQLELTPMSPMTLMAGKIVPYALFGLVDEALILVVSNLLFEVPLHGLPLIFLSTAAYLTATLGVGLLVATLARTQQQALMAGFFFILPAILLSGFLSPLEAMPSWVRAITLFNPVRHYVELCRSILVRGAGFTEVLRPLASLTALGFGVLTLAAMRFRSMTA